MGAPQRIGVISDTHGLLRPEAASALHGVDLILHAGDVGRPDVLAELQRIAPVRAVRGNVDVEPWARTLPQTCAVHVEDVSIWMLHDISDLALDPVEAGYQVVVYGHSHRPKIETKRGVLHLNPGSAGPRRFRLPISLAFLQIAGSSVQPELRELEIS